MSYGRSFPTVSVPLTFVCQECSVSVTIQVDAGKDYIYEDTCKKAVSEMESCCNWSFGSRNQDYKTVLCFECTDPTDRSERDLQ